MKAEENKPVLSMDNNQTTEWHKRLDDEIFSVLFAFPSELKRGSSRINSSQRESDNEAGGGEKCLLMPLRLNRRG